MSETPDNNVNESAPTPPVPRPKRSPLTIIAVSVVALLVLGGAAFAAVTIIGQQQQLSHLTQLEADRMDASSAASASASAAAEAAARAAAVPGLTESIASGETAYTDSEGHVSDESLRTTLRSALDAGAAALADPSSTGAELEAAKAAIDSAVAAVVAAHVANWNDINGTWCLDPGNCRTITNNKSSYGDEYVQDGPPDANGCLWGYTGPPGEAHNASVTYCPKGATFVDREAGCTMPEDVTRDRLYVRQDCGVPYYRS